MSEPIQAPGPVLPWGTVMHSALSPFADGEDPDQNPDFHLVKDLVATFTLYVTSGGVAKELPAAVWTENTTAHTFVPPKIVGKYDDTGRLRLVIDSVGTMSDSQNIRLMANDSPSVHPTGTYWQVSWSNARLPSGTFVLAAGETVDLSSVILGSVRPGESGRVFADLLAAAFDLRAAIAEGSSGDGSGGGGTAATWPVPGTPTTFTPTAHKNTHATGGSDPLTPANIGAASAAQGTKADTALQSVSKADVGLNNVNNTADANKPVSSSMQSALDRRVLVATGQPGEVSHGFYAAGDPPPPVPAADGLLHTYYQGV